MQMVSIRLLVDSVTVGLVFLWVLWFSRVSNILPVSILIFILKVLF